MSDVRVDERLGAAVVFGGEMIDPDGAPNAAVPGRTEMGFPIPDWDGIVWMASNPHDHLRAEAASVAWRYGPKAEPLLIGLLDDQSLYPDTDVASTAAYGLKMIGAEPSRAPLLRMATAPEFVRGRKEAAKEALLAVEARLGILSQRPRRESFWIELPTAENQTRVPIGSFWRLAYEERLHGPALAEALATPAVWPRRQALAAAMEQETDPNDLQVLIRHLGDPKLSVASVLWRYGPDAEPILLDHLGEDAAWSLERVGTERSLEPLRRHIAEGRGELWFTYRAQSALGAVEARLRS